jgi:hypothetical protein
MATYKNTSKGARTIKLVGGGYKLVEAGASITVRSDLIARVGPDLVLDKSTLAKPSAAAVKAVTAKPAASKPRTRKAPARRKAAAKPKAG